MIKRLISGAILLAIVTAILLSNNTIIVNITAAIVSLIAINEYCRSLKIKSRYERIFADLVAISIAFLEFIPTEKIIIMYPLIVIGVFLEVIFTEMRVNYMDILKIGFGIIYIVGFFVFVPIIYREENGVFLIWYIAIAAWGTDTVAYWLGSKFGKHKFTSISPKKSIEGSTSGIIGAVILALVYTYYINNYADMDFSMISVAEVTIILSILSQIGDLAASSIKRCVGIKDFSNLIPGHGGMLDRIDSILFIAPFAFFLLTLI